jgi:hypothetical protein
LRFEANPGKIIRETLSQKKTHQKKGGGVAQGAGPEFKPQYHKKKKKEQGNSTDNVIKNKNNAMYVGKISTSIVCIKIIK